MCVKNDTQCPITNIKLITKLSKNHFLRYEKVSLELERDYEKSFIISVNVSIGGFPCIDSSRKNPKKTLYPLEKGFFGCN